MPSPAVAKPSRFGWRFSKLGVPLGTVDVNGADKEILGSLFGIRHSLASSAELMPSRRRTAI